MTATYLLWDADDNLLYVGESMNPMQRITDHRCTQEWGDQIAAVDWIDLSTPEEAAELEKELIQELHPRYNRRWNPSHSRPSRRDHQLIKVEEDIYDDIRRYAEQEDRSISAIVRRAMKAYAKQTKR